MDVQAEDRARDRAAAAMGGTAGGIDRHVEVPGDCLGRAVTPTEIAQRGLVGVSVLLEADLIVDGRLVAKAGQGISWALAAQHGLVGAQRPVPVADLIETRSA